MIINLTQALHDYKGEEITEQIQKKENGNIDISVVPLTLKSALLTCLNNFLANEEPSVEDKLHSHALSMDIWKNDEINASAEDIVYMKDRAGRVWSTPSVYVAICEILDGKVKQKVSEPITEEVVVPLAPEGQTPEGQ